MKEEKRERERERPSQGPFINFFFPLLRVSEIERRYGSPFKLETKASIASGIAREGVALSRPENR